MSTSKFDELVEIVSKDYKETDEYLKRNCAFINQLTQELSNYLECGMENLFLYASIKERKSIISLAKNNIKDLINDDNLIRVTNEGYFVVPLLIQIKPEPFSTSYWSPSFKENQLTPQSQVVLIMSIKQQQQENLFSVVAPAINQKKQVVEEVFNINLTINDSWSKLIESCFKVIKTIIEGGVEKRIAESLIKKDNTFERAFGVSLHRN
jgi:hypothetical protein